MSVAAAAPQIRTRYSRRDAAAYLGISEAMLDRIAHVIGRCKIGRRVIYRIEDLDRYCERNFQRPAKPVR